MKLNKADMERLKAYMERFKDKLNGYSNTSQAQFWLEQNIDRVKALFANVSLHDFILEPFQGAFSLSSDGTEV